MTTLPSAFAYAGIPYQVFGDSSGAVAVTVICTRSASARSSGAISVMLSRTACRPSAFLAPFLPSARNSAARFFIAARSSALKPPDSVVALFAGILGLPFLTLGGSVSCRPSTERLGSATPWRFSIPDRIGVRHAGVQAPGGGVPGESRAPVAAVDLPCPVGSLDDMQGNRAGLYRRGAAAAADLPPALSRDARQATVPGEPGG